MDQLLSIVQSINGLMWNLVLLILLCGTGIFFTFRLKFVQVRKLGASFKKTFGGLSLKGKAAGADGMSSFQSLATALAAQVGTGNLAGAATALVSGGPGAIFWMWVSAFFGMATIYAEATLGQKYKTTVDGQVTGGPVYYIKAAFPNAFGKVLAAIFAVLIIFALGFMGNMVQSNSIGSAFSALNVPPWITGVIISVLSLLVFMGGVKRIASVTEKIVPIMAGFFLLGGLILLVLNFRGILPAFRDIFVGAFKPNAVLGGVLGVTVKDAVRYGVARGLFSNEAGMGSTPHAHAIAKVDHPCEQGLVAMMGVFIDTFVVLNMTVLTIMTTGILDGTRKGIELTQFAYTTVFGTAGTVFIAVCLLFFAFSTIVGWYFFGESNFKYLFGKKAVPVYTILVAICIVVGSCLKLDLVWEMADMFNGLMVIPNLLALVALSGVVVKLNKDFENSPLGKNIGK